MVTSNDLFYSRLPVNVLPLSELLTEEHLFFKVPDNWHVLITDVKNSTQAAMEGKHQTVNLVATGSIVAALNVAFKENILIPFFFGGDGATFIIPPTLLDATIVALQQHRQNTLTNFSMDLRVGHVPVTEIYQQGHELKVSKLKTSNIFNIPVLLGNGLQFAERIIKGVDYKLSTSVQSNNDLDMSGMHCRWDKIKPPVTNFEVVSLIVMAKDETAQSSAFRQVMELIEKIYGSQEVRKPISVDKLRMVASLKKVGAEMRTRLGSFNAWYLVKTWMTTVLGKVYFRTKKGKEYLYKLVDMSDTLVIDGRINTVITGTISQGEELKKSLQELEQQGSLLFGFHSSTASVMSCYVRNMDDQHIHFIDGADGGYTKAAGLLKKKIASLQTS